MAGWDGNGNFTVTHDWTSDRDTGIKINADRMDTQDGDMVSGINNCLTKDGQNAPTANLPMGAKKHTNIANSSARTEYSATGQVQDGAFNYATDSGAADAYVIGPSPAITAYAAGQTFKFIAGNASTGASTLNVSGLGVKTIKKNGNADDLEAGDIGANDLVTVTYDGTVFQLWINQETDITGKADKISGGTENRVVTIDASENIQDSGVLISGVARRPGSAATGNICEFDANDDPVDSGQTVTSVNPFGNALLHIEHQETDGTDGGTATSGSWETRTLNTVVTNEISGASLATNQITLPAGDYIVEATATFYQTSSTRLALYDTTGAAYLKYGMSYVFSGTDVSTMDARIASKFTLGVESVIELRSRVASSTSNIGWGADTNFGVNEVYAIVRIWKV